MPNFTETSEIHCSSRQEDLASILADFLLNYIEYPLTFFSYVLLSYILKHDDGRVSYPLMFIFISPQGKYSTSVTGQNAPKAQIAP